MIEALQEYVQRNAVPLFASDPAHRLKVLFNPRGFVLSPKAQRLYALIKNLPHLYVAFSDQPEGYYYIGQSSQTNGRWRSGHYYHLGTLAHHLLGTVKRDEQSHQHWIDAWMRVETVQLKQSPYSIELKAQTYISFIPFELYSTTAHDALNQVQKKAINNPVEQQLIESYRLAGYRLLNKQHNRPLTLPSY